MSHYQPWAQPIAPQYYRAPLGASASVHLGPPVTGDSEALKALLLGVTCVFSYYVGTAVAPTEKSKKMWGLVGIPVGVFGGAWGLGIMAIVALRRK